MAIRIEVQPDGKIEIMRPGHSHPYLYWTDLKRAQRVICYLLREEHARATKERFVPQATKEARKAWKTMEAKANAETKSKAAGFTRR